MLVSLLHLSLDAFGFVFNIVLLAAIILKTPQSFKSYAVILLNSTLADTIAILIDAFVLQRIIIVPPTLAYLSNGLCSLINERVCFVAYSTFVTYLPHSVLMLAASFSYRYLVLVRPQISPPKLQLMLFLIHIPMFFTMVLISETQAPRNVILDTLKSSGRKLDLETVTGHIHYTEPLLICALAIIFFVPSIAYLVIFIARRCVQRELQQQAACMSTASRKNHRTLIKALTYHAAVPSVYGVGCVLFILVYYGAIASESLEYVISLIPATIPCVNPMLTLYFITPYRRLIFRIVPMRQPTVSTVYAKDSIAHTR